MENPDNVLLLSHAGMESGINPFVFNKIIYGATKQSTKIEAAYFFNDLSPRENIRLQRWSAQFDAKVLNSETFRKKIATVLQLHF
ncbi:MAG: hypothetical protein HY305_07290 [Sphingobacteriales bacterium]|nr:hypothetical protein [Sphingobacteriales bacterium]